MSAPAAPTIPPRPSRSQHTQNVDISSEVPKIPPRPTSHAQSRIDRSVSPGRDAFPHSPLNETPFNLTLGRSISNDPSNLSLPPRPPSVTLPSIGQEGNEYADLGYEHTPPRNAGPAQATQTRNVGADLQLHAPKPSLSKSSAKAQVQAVTRTDPQTAAALGLGTSATPTYDDSERLSRTLNSKTSFSRPDSSSASTERRLSVQHGDDHGIPELGMRVPINPYVGDVQAPSPAPFALATSSAHNSHSRPRHHTRTRSGRDVILPPGSYGLHGHGGHVPVDQFEKAWYDKHPEALRDEHGHYTATGSGRGEWALSSDDLNKLVRDTASRGAGFGAAPDVVAYPDEQIGFMASEKYSSRMASPALQHHPSLPSSTQPPFESPLRKSVSAEHREQTGFPQSQESLEDIPETIVNEDGDIIHIDPPSRRASKIHGGAERDTEDLGPHGGNTEEEGGWIDEQGYGAPILASDEVAKENGAEYMQPAVSPHRERRDSSFRNGEYDGYASGIRTPSSRPGSRPGSVHGGLPGLSRFTSRVDERDDMHTPLEDVEEYEPLFPDEEEDEKKKPVTAADRFKARPDTLKRRFPSQDIWEDTPNSLMHVTTVSTPDLAQENQSAASSSNTFESPEAEAARKGEVSEAEKKELVPKEERLAKSRFAPHLRDDTARPGMLQRFPSQDIWEDSPDSMNLVTTVQRVPTDEAKSPPDISAAKPTVPPRPTRAKVSEQATEPSVPLSQPTIPARPPKRVHQVPPPLNADPVHPTQKQVSPTESKKAPVIPERPKPQVPTRPAKVEASDLTSNLTKSVSATSAGSAGSADGTREVTSPPIFKAKPTIPARPAGAKIAQLQAGFMSDLNKKLQIGPKPVEKEPEPELETEKAPLSDARKGRARGPQRRKPAASPGGEMAAAAPHSRLAIATAWSIFEIGDDNVLAVHGHKQASIAGMEEASVPDSTPANTPASALQETSGPSSVPADVPSAAESGQPVTKEEVASIPSSMAPSLATNTAGEPADPLARQPPPPGNTEPADLARVSRQSTMDSSKVTSDPLSKVSTSTQNTQPDPEPSTAPMSRHDHSVTEEITGAGDAVETSAETAPKAGITQEPTPSLPHTLSDKDLEEMTTLADGKSHAAEEPEALRQQSASS